MHRALRQALACVLLMVSCLFGLSMAAGGEEEAEIVLSFAGDCTLGAMKELQNYAAGFVQLVAEKGFEHPFSGVKHIFEQDDVTLVNLEGTFTDSKTAQDKAFAFRAPPEYAEILPLGSVEAVNIANNHILDFLEEGREDTLEALTRHGVEFSGDGTIACVDARGIRVGMTGYSYPHRKTLEKLAGDISRLRAAGCDIIVFSMHAGTEEQYLTGGEQKDLARGAIDLGADIVVGHHPHVISGVEIYRGKPIFYSLGNFAFGGNNNPGDWDTMIAQVVVKRDAGGVSLSEMRIIPCLISGSNRMNDFCPVVATGERAASIMRKIRRYSAKEIDPALFETGALKLQ